MTTLVPMPFTTSSRGVSYATPNSIIVEEAGSYYITYGMYLLFNAPAILTVAVRSNGTNIIPATVTATGPSTNYAVPRHESIIVELPAGAVIDIAITSSVAQTMALDGETPASLYLFKLN